MVNKTNDIIRVPYLYITSSSHLICDISLGNKARNNIIQVKGKDKFLIDFTFVKSLKIFRTINNIQFK